MHDLPILFSAPMVRALLDDRKTQTRRVLNPQPYPLEGRPGYWNASGVVGGRICISDRALLDLHRKPKPGDRLYVREAWRSAAPLDDTPPREMDDLLVPPVRYEADGEVVNWREWRGHDAGRLRAAMHMPRWASRLTLTITDVRMQRLQEISEADARAEGVLWVPGHGEIEPADLQEGYSNYLNCREGFQVLWDSLNADRGYGWDANPWVIAISFDVIRENIDSLRGRAG